MEEESEVDNTPDEIPCSKNEEIRYWSDFNRVYYVPRTVQKIPDVADWENTEGDWNLGQETFERYNEASVGFRHQLPHPNFYLKDTELMEGPLRLFLEECDSVQVRLRTKFMDLPVKCLLGHPNYGRHINFRFLYQLITHVFSRRICETTCFGFSCALRSKAKQHRRRRCEQLSRVYTYVVFIVF